MSTYQVAVYHLETGQIKQIVTVTRAEDVAKQHLAWPGHGYADVTGQEKKPHPNAHMLDLSTKKLVPRVAPVPEQQQTKSRALEKDCFSAIVGGFRSSATGRALTYPSAEQDQLNMMQAAMVGGTLSAFDGSAWVLVDHTADQAKAVLQDFARHRDAHRKKLSALKSQIAQAKSTDAVSAVAWAKSS